MYFNVDVFFFQNCLLGARFLNTENFSRLAQLDLLMAISKVFMEWRVKNL